MRRSLLYVMFIMSALIMIGCQTELPLRTNPVLIADAVFNEVITEIDALFETYDMVDDDIILPTEFLDYPELNVIWTSSERSIISHRGIFKAPNVDTSLTIKVNLIYGDYMFDKTYTVLAKAIIIDDEEPIDKPDVPYETAMQALSTLALHAQEKDAQGNFEMDTFYGVKGLIVGLSGQNQAFMFSEGAFIIIEGLIGVKLLKQDFYYHISGRLVYDQHMPKLMIDRALSHIIEVEELYATEPLYEDVSLDELTDSHASDILLFARAVVIEGYLNQFELTNAEGNITIPISTDYDAIFETRYVRIQSIIYFDSTQQIWLFVDDTFIIEETMEPCPACVI